MTRVAVQPEMFRWARKGAGLAGGATISAMESETIRREALSLPVRERAALAEQLLSSLDALSEDEIAQLWLQEAVRRADEIDSGMAKRVSGEVVQLEARALLR